MWIVTLLYVVAPVAYAAQWPERRRPGGGLFFDLLGASHQIMHVCVLAAALLNGWCMERARALREEVRLCTEPAGAGQSSGGPV